MRKTVCFLLAATLPLLAACDGLAELLDIPNPAKEAAEAEAIGSACRHAGRSLEDCYILNPSAPKASIFAGWKAMNDYMLENNLHEVPSVLQPESQSSPPAPSPAANAAPTAGLPAAGSSAAGSPAARNATSVSSSQPQPFKP
jgi:hypothetical protein